MKNRPRQFDRSIICTAKIRSIDFKSTQLRSIKMRSIDFQSKTFSIDRLSIDRHIFDRATSHLPEGRDISKSLCDPNRKLSLTDRNGRRVALFVRLGSTLDGLLLIQISIYMRLGF